MPAGLSSTYTRKRLRRFFLRCPPVELPSGALDRVGGVLVSDVLAVPHLLTVGRTPKDGSVVGPSLQLNVGWLKVWSHVGILTVVVLSGANLLIGFGLVRGRVRSWSGPLESPGLRLDGWSYASGGCAWRACEQLWT